MVKIFFKLVDKQKSYDLLKFFGLKFSRVRATQSHTSSLTPQKKKK